MFHLSVPCCRPRLTSRPMSPGLFALFWSVSQEGRWEPGWERVQGGVLLPWFPWRLPLADLHSSSAPERHPPPHQSFPHLPSGSRFLLSSLQAEGGVKGRPGSHRQYLGVPSILPTPLLRKQNFIEPSSNNYNLSVWSTSSGTPTDTVPLRKQGAFIQV